MNITGLITGFLMLLAPVEEVNITSQIYKGVVLTGKVIEKTEEGTWGASAHEEGYQIIKDAIFTGQVSYDGNSNSIRKYINVLDAAKACADVLRNKYKNKHIIVTGKKKIKVSSLPLWSLGDK